MTKQLERAIDLAEEYCGTPYGEARDELEAVRAKVRGYDTLWERARTVIVTFEALGRTRSVPEQMTLHRRCEGVLVSLKETLDLDGPDDTTPAEGRG